MVEKDILRLDSVVKILGEKVILYDVSLSVKQGEILGLIGGSGSGKTTLLRSMIGFFTPERGQVLVRSAIIQGHQHHLYTPVSNPSSAVKQVFGFASQHPSVYMDMTVDENIEYFASLYGLSKAQYSRTANLLLSLMDLGHARQTKAINLSGGMQRRLDIICAMIHKPKILILDEPTADLDPFLRRHIWEMIHKIAQQGTTIVVSSHSLADLEMLCDRVAVMHKGRVLAVGTPEKIKKSYITTERVSLQTYPGKYTSLVKKLSHESIADIFQEGQELVITTTDVESTLQHVINVVQSCNESLTSIKVLSGTLDEAFLQLSEAQLR
ncbi:MAG: ABC transporter ATP-binding protein [Candidatus Woesearchaeota archaeon]